MFHAKVPRGAAVLHDAVQGQETPWLSVLVEPSHRLETLTEQDWNPPELSRFPRLLPPASTLCTVLALP